MCSAKPLIDSSQRDVSKGKPLFCQAIDSFDERVSFHWLKFICINPCSSSTVDWLLQSGAADLTIPFLKKSSLPYPMRSSFGTSSPPSLLSWLWSLLHSGRLQRVFLRQEADPFVSQQVSNRQTTGPEEPAMSTLR